MKSPPEDLTDPEAERAAKRLSSISGGRVLDVATGDGTFIQTLMKSLKDYESFIGVDISAEKVESAREGLKEEPVEILEMNAESLEFENEHFDSVCISYSLHHMVRLDEVLAEMNRVLKPGGHFIVTESYSDGNQTEAQRTEIASHRWDAEIDSLRGTPHKKTLRRDEIKEALGNLGLAEIEIFDSTQSINCLLCDRWSECSDPMNKEGIEKSIKGIERNLGHLKEVEEPETRSRLKREGEELKERIRRTGTSPACNLLFIGKK
ncbi:MAG: methyltransferase domain-containing protein [Thermoplasmata archaeon]|nr:methyltransferase domain-containing protein [Thermoplasmata archaeon]